jgi:SAM-dependent methyltransferase
MIEEATDAPRDAAVLHYHGRELEMGGAANYHAWILREFEPYIRGRVAEVGAGSGNVSTLLLDRGVGHLLAVEPSINVFPQLAARLAQHDRATVSNQYFHQVVPRIAGTMNAVLYINVLEHIERDAAELRLAYEALSPGGHVCIFVPALQGLYSQFDAEVGHFRRYHLRPLRRLVEGAGFRVIKSHYFDIAGCVAWFVAYRLLKGGIVGGQVSLYDRWVVPVMSRLEALLPPPVGKNLVIVGVKPQN